MHRLKLNLPKGFYALPLILMVVISLTIVCASLSSTMLIDGDAYLRADADIRIDSIEMMNPVEGAFEPWNSLFTKDSTTLYANLPQLESTITFRVTVKNQSSDTYILSDISSSLTNESITCNVDEYVGTVIDAGDTVTLDITFKYDVDSLPEEVVQTAIFNYTFEKPSASMIEYTSEYTSKTNLQDALDELFEIYDE